MSDDEVARLLHERAHVPFDLKAGIPFKVLLVRRGPDDHFLLLTLHHNIALRASVSVAVFDRRLADERRLRVVLNKGEVAALPPHAAKAAQVMISDRAVARGAVGLLGRRALKRAESADRVEGDVLRLAASAPVACVDNPRQVALAILAERWWDKVHEDGRVWRRVGLVVDE